MAKTSTQDAPLDSTAAVNGTQPVTPTAPAATNGTAPSNGTAARRLNVNRVEIIGFLAKTPMPRTTKNGWAITDIVVSTHERQSQDVSFVAWHELAEWATEHFVAGNPVRVVGRVVVRTYTGEDGNERKYIELRADHIFPAQLQPLTAEPVDVEPFAEG
jgi:single-strand DNA-binding protein